MDPALALPSYRVYRGSIIALLVGSIVAVWLLVLPPAGADQDGPPDSIARLVNTPSATAPPEVTATAEGTGEGDATATATAGPDGTPTPTATPTPTPEPEVQTYIVQSGDTLFGIAEQFAPVGSDAAAFSQRIAEANGLSDLSQLQIGDELVIPAS
jgi:nucleoid-associated protein YgaU